MISFSYENRIKMSNLPIAKYIPEERCTSCDKKYEYSCYDCQKKICSKHMLENDNNVYCLKCSEKYELPEARYFMSRNEIITFIRNNNERQGRVIQLPHLISKEDTIWLLDKGYKFSNFSIKIPLF